MKLDHRGFLKTAGLSAASLIRLGGVAGNCWPASAERQKVPLSKVASTRSKTFTRIAKWEPGAKYESVE